VLQVLFGRRDCIRFLKVNSFNRSSARERTVRGRAGTLLRSPWLSDHPYRRNGRSFQPPGMHCASVEQGVPFGCRL